MTIATTHSSVRALGNGVNKIFNFDFILRDEDDLRVQVGINEVDPSAYTVSIDPEDFTGSVTFAVAPADQVVVELARVMPLTQGTKYPVAGPFPAQDHERALDKLTMIVQQQQRIIDAGAGYSPLAGLWVPGKDYKRFQIVNIADGTIYMCLNDHTSGLTFAGDQLLNLWELYINVPAEIYADIAQAAKDAAIAASDRDIADGLPGLTQLKINFMNALGTIKSFFTNDNTAARTYTFKDRDGIIADDTDLAGKADATSTTNALALKAPLASPALTENPTAPTQASTDASTKLATTEHVANSFPGSAGPSGYQKFKNGIVIQWGQGTTSVSANTMVNFNFPLAFTAVYAGVITGGYNATIHRQSISTTAIGVQSSSTSVPFHWIAIGYITPA